MSKTHSFFATCSRGLEQPLSMELSELLGQELSPAQGGVAFEGSLEQGYRAVIWSRVASRLLLLLDSFSAADDASLYRGASGVDWHALGPGIGSLCVDFAGRPKAVDNTHYGAQRIKDAVVDQLRDRTGTRPTVDKEAPELRINVHADGEAVQIALDLAGGPMHRRGYRKEGRRAPLKESLAAGLLIQAGWLQLCDQQGVAFCDPMCGSGTLPIEAALMAADVAPGLLRGTLGSRGWAGHDRALWQELQQEAQERDLRKRRLEQGPLIVGSDKDEGAVRVALANARRAGVSEWLRFDHVELAKCLAPAKSGLLLVNPPYGERLGEVTALERLYLKLGEVLKERFGGWRAGVLSSEKRLGQAVGLKAEAQHDVFNGPLRCRLMVYPLTAKSPQKRGDADPLVRVRRLLSADEAEGLANRLRKNLKHLKKWARREGISCYRVYDADLPTFASAIDRYEDALVVQEYQPPKDVPPKKADERLRDTVLIASELLEIDPEHVFVKQRRRQRGREQYERQDEQALRYLASEGGQHFWLNLSDYLDTGLFLHHRRTRQLLAERGVGKRFLNLFCYTASATVQVAAGGAASSLSVDMSKTYVDWARDNFRQNGLNVHQHELLQADCLGWIEDQGRRGGQRFDLIFCDPPSFSNSKRMQRTLDIQRDHGELIHSVARLLAPGGELVFSTNKKRFSLAEEELAGLKVEELTAKTTSEDFRRKPLHRCWSITR